MAAWTMSWGDHGRRVDPPLVAAEELAARPVPAGSARVVRVRFHGLDLPEEPLLVAWDDGREVVRLADGRLRWFHDGSRQAYPRDGGIVVEDAAEHAYPRGNRFMDALVVRSVEDLMETVGADEVTTVEADGTLHVRGEHDGVHARAVVADDTGIVLRADGVRGRSWQLEVLQTWLVGAGEGLLEPADLPS